jgi:excisionase family DNA binding protein
VTAGLEVAAVTEDSWLKIHEAMALCGVSRRTIYHWMAKGRLTVLRTAGGGPRILASSLFRDEQGRRISAEPA